MSTFSPFAPTASDADSLLEVIHEMVKKEFQYKSDPHVYSREARGSRKARDAPSPWSVPSGDGDDAAGSELDFVDLMCREQMCQWALQISDYCGFSNETVEIAMNLLDRALSSDSAWSHSVLRDRTEYQLAAMTSLYTAIKIHEMKAVSPATLAGVSNGAYQAHDIEKMELRILESAGWLVHPPTTSAFTHGLIELLTKESIDHSPSCERLSEDIEGMREALVEVCSMQAGLAVKDYGTFGGVHPSAVAVAALRSALGRLAIDQGKCDSILMRAVVLNPAQIPDFIKYIACVQRHLLKAIALDEDAERKYDDMHSNYSVDDSAPDYIVSDDFSPPAGCDSDGDYIMTNSIHETSATRDRESPRSVYSHERQQRQREHRLAPRRSITAH